MVALISKDPDDYVNGRPLVSLGGRGRKPAPDEIGFRDWKLGTTPPLKVLVFAVGWFALAYLCMYISGSDAFSRGTWIFLVLAPVWLAQFDARRHAGAAARAETRWPSPRVAAFGSAPWGLIVLVQIITVLAVSTAVAVITSQEPIQLSVFYLGLIVAFGPSWALEWWFGRADRADARSLGPAVLDVD